MNKNTSSNYTPATISQVSNTLVNLKTDHQQEVENVSIVGDHKRTFNYRKKPDQPFMVLLHQKGGGLKGMTPSKRRSVRL